MGEFTHFNNRGEAVMVDVSEKKQTVREAIAAGTITMRCVRRWIKVWKSEISVWKRKPGEKAGYTRGRWKAGSSK